MLTWSMVVRLALTCLTICLYYAGLYLAFKLCIFLTLLASRSLRRRRV